MFDLSHILDMALLGFRHKNKVKKLNKNVSFYRNPYFFKVFVNIPQNRGCFTSKCFA